MYRASSESPIFDAPDIPTLRRVKPLPKRRRTSDSAPLEVDPDSGGGVLGGGGLGINALGLATAGLLASEDFNPKSLTAHLQSYFLPQDSPLFHHPDPSDGRASTPGGIDSIHSGYGYSDSRNGQDDDGGEGDYIDHLQQPGNTKKRKVPANMTGAPHGPESGSGSGGEDEITDRAIPTGRTDQEYDAMGLQNSLALSSSTSGGGSAQRRGRLSKATLAGLQHKELLKNRKRQLAVVLGALSHGDSLALDQALSTTYPFAYNRLTNDGSPPEVKVRPSKRKVVRMARAYKTFYASLRAQNPDAKPDFPESSFSFVCHSSTSDRLVETKGEVATLHARFEAELARQTARAAEAAKQAAAAAMNNRQSKRADRSKQARSVSKKVDQKPADQTQTSAASRTGKKKKRSALANASNPHHLRNYVPSRLPHSGQLSAAQAQTNAQNLVSPLPLRFLSADVPPRRRSKSNVAPVTNLTSPLDEWICPFCEYDLFFGDDPSFQRAIRNRKKILKRRRRARERAAAAASGAKAATAKNPAPVPVDDDANPGFEAPHDDVVAANAKQARVKEGDRGPGIGQGVGHGGSGQVSLG